MRARHAGGSSSSSSSLHWIKLHASVLLSSRQLYAVGDAVRWAVRLGIGGWARQGLENDTAGWCAGTGAHSWGWGFLQGPALQYFQCSKYLVSLLCWLEPPRTRGWKDYCGCAAVGFIPGLCGGRSGCHKWRLCLGKLPVVRMRNISRVRSATRRVAPTLWTHVYVHQLNAEMFTGDDVCVCACVDGQ